MLVRCLSAILDARPALSPVVRAVVEAIHLSRGPIGSAEAVARRTGLGSRFRLARLLRREGLPPLHRIAGWATILSWVLDAETTGASLCRMAFHSDRHPAACYRLVSEITGVTWEAVRAHGYEWAEREFLKEMGVRDPVLPPRHTVPVKRCRVPTFARLRAVGVPPWMRGHPHVSST
jgi:hypothetical protein